MTPAARRLFQASESAADNIHGLAVHGLVGNGVVDVALPSDLSLWSANQLAVRAQGGCASAFAVLADRYRPRLIRFIDKRVAQHAVDAEDVTQEVLAKAWQTLDRFSPRYQFATWLYTMATRTATDHLRRSEYLRQTGQSATHPHLESIADGTLSHEKCVEISESVDNIWAVATRVLKEDQYAVLWLRYGEELSIKDIARVMGKTGVGVRVLLHRSRSALQPHLQQFNSEGTRLKNQTEGSQCSNSLHE